MLQNKDTCMAYWVGVLHYEELDTKLLAHTRQTPLQWKCRGQKRKLDLDEGHFETFSNGSNGQLYSSSSQSIAIITS